MIKAQRNMDAGLGYGTSPDQLFASMGMSKTATYDGNGFPVQTENTQPAPQAVEAEPLAEPTTTSESELAPEITSISPAPSNEYDLSGKFNGRFKSIDELESYLTEVETKANKDPFANDLVRDLNKAIEQGVDPDLYLAVSQLDVEELSEKEALVLEMQWKKGLSQEDAEFLVERNYKLDSDLDELDMSDPDVREAQIRLKLDAQEAKDFLGQYKKDALVPPAEKLQAELTQAWTPVIPQVMDKWKTFQVTSKSGTYNIPASDTAIQSAQSLLTEVINSGMLDAMPDKDGLAIANAIVEKEIIKIDLQHAIDYVAETLKSKQMEEKHNPRKPQGQTGSPMPSEEQGIIDFLKKVRY